MKKPLATAVITQELAQSVFFAKAPGEPAPEPAPAFPPLQVSPNHAPTRAAPQRPQGEEAEQVKRDANQQEGQPDVVHDVMTSVRQAISLKVWQELIENTETQNSALRLTSAERYAVEDVVNELRRQYGIKTSMNEVARLGLLVLIHDFKQHKQASLLHTVKKA